MRSLLPCLPFLLLILGVDDARAMPAFPPEIQAELELDYQPPCSLCHATASGGGPIAKPFGLAMQARGLTTSDLSSVARALARMEQEQVDGNSNGVPDVQDLKNGSDPNDPGSGSLTGPQPEYGCAVPRAAIHPEHPLSLVLAVLVAAGLAYTQRRTRRSGAKLLRTPASGR